jgi:hypothetical protein
MPIGKTTPTPRNCLHTKPTGKSILFCDVFIHLPSVHMLSGLSMSYLSLVFSRKREPSLEAAEKIAAALHMGLEEFLLGLRGRVVRIRKGWRGGKQTKMRNALVASQLT